MNARGFLTRGFAISDFCSVSASVTVVMINSEISKSVTVIVPYSILLAAESYKVGIGNYEINAQIVTVSNSNSLFDSREV